MGLPMLKCEICGRDIPKHIMPKHIAKWHDGVKTETKEVTSIPESEKLVEEIKEVLTEKMPWYIKWDAGEITTCSQCHTEWPSKLMGFHLRFEHGL